LVAADFDERGENCGREEKENRGKGKRGFYLCVWPELCLVVSFACRWLVGCQIVTSLLIRFPQNIVFWPQKQGLLVWSNWKRLSKMHLAKTSTESHWQPENL